MGRNKSKWWPEAVDIIRHYPKYKNELEHLYAEYAYAHGGDSEVGVRVQTSTISDGAADPLFNAMSDERWKYLNNAVKAVEYAIAMANTYDDAKDRLEYIKLRYWDNRYTHYGAAMEVCTSHMTASRWNTGFIKDVARKMGFI